MADLSVRPVSTDIKPVPGISLADVVNVARGAQAYQAGEINLEQQNIANLEQRAVAEAIKQDPNLFMTDNRLDLDKVNRIIPQLAPRTQAIYLQTYNTLHKAQTDAIQAKASLSQDFKTKIGTRYGVLGRAGVADPAAYIAEGELMKKEYPDMPDLHKYIDAANTSFRMAQPGTNVSQMAIRGAESLLTPQQISEVFGPKTGTLNLGTDIMQTTTVQRPGGAMPEIIVGRQLGIAQLTPGQRFVRTGRIGSDNRELIQAYDKEGGFIGTFSEGDLEAANAGKLPGVSQSTTDRLSPAQMGTDQLGQIIRDRTGAPPVTTQTTNLPSAYRTPVRIPPFETPESGNTYRTQAMAAREQVQPARNAVDNIRTIRQYLPLAQTGRYSEAIAGLQSVLGNVAGSKPEELAAAARDIIEKNIADLALQKNSALGGKFAADLAAVQNSLATAGKNPTAIAKVMDQLEPLMQHVSNYSTGLERAIAKSPNSYYVKPEFDRAMNEAYDPLALRMKNAFDTGGREGLNKWLKDNKVNLTEQQLLLQKLQAYGRLVRGD